MGSKGKNNRAQRKMLTAVCAVLSVILALLIVLVVWLGTGKMPGNQIPGTTAENMTTVVGMKELQVQSITEQGDTVLVATTYGTVSYPYAFSDLISVEAETFTDYAVLDFSAKIGDKTYKLYTLMFDGEEGMPIGTLRDGSETYTVTAQFHDVSGIGDDNMITFYAAQETFNDVVNSLSENEGFTSTD